MRHYKLKPDSPFKRFNSSPEIIRLVVMMYVRFPLSLRNVEDLLSERGIDLSYETVRFWWSRFGPLFAADVRRQRVSQMRGICHWQWHLDEVYVKINGETHYLWRAVDHEGEVLERYVTNTRDKKAALAFMKKTLKRHGSPETVNTDCLGSYKAAMRDLGNGNKQEIGRHANKSGRSREVAVRNAPKTIRVDNRPGFISRALDRWAYQAGVTLDFSRPGRPTDNAFVESLNGRLCEECMSSHRFLSVADARVRIEAWRRDYNESRPHTALGWLTPAEYAASAGLNPGGCRPETRVSPG